MEDVQRTISPVDGSVYVERPFASERDIRTMIEAARRAQAEWRVVPVPTRAAVCTRFVDALVAKTTDVAREISWQMGRPVAQSPKELGGFQERALYMIGIAADALADISLPDKTGFTRFIRREPLGVVLTIAPWNYPYLTAVNSVVPAIMAGNAVVLRHSGQTPLCAERLGEAFDAAGLPPSVFQYLHCRHADATRLISDPGIDFVAFTGSVAAGHLVQRAAAGRFIGTGLELGGKDPAYVRADADLAHAVASLVDGAFFNSGQSCCGIERIYVHRDVYQTFVEEFAATTRQYRLGSPLDPAVTLGPMVKASAADFVRGQIAEALAAGARPLIDDRAFPADRPGTPYLAPQALIGVDHSMRIMTEETFGPAVGIMRVQNDDEAVALMNDSPYGLTAAVWTADPAAAIAIGNRVETGTWFMNRCDYLDPALAWTGVKDSGRGCTLSRLGYDVLTRPKSFHLRTAVPETRVAPSS
jgi:acyl-CoA reductase-like NAD-dependent aldehyde dehydrogenase